MSANLQPIQGDEAFLVELMPLCLLQIVVGRPTDQTIRWVYVIDVLYFYSCVSLTVCQSQTLGVVDCFGEWRAIVTWVYARVSYI